MRDVCAALPHGPAKGLGSIMKSKKLKVTAANLCGASGPDDGIDPRILVNREQKNKDTTRKDRQLCKEVYRALTLATSNFDLHGALGLTIDSVVTAPAASRLRVAVSFARTVSIDDAEYAVGRLRAATGILREELAAAISRKRVPDLTFVLATEEDTVEEESDEG